MNYEVAIAAATNLALSAHSGQVRKYTGEAYFAHPMRVAASVEALYPGNPHAVLIAILHDVVEDTEVTIEEIAAGFGDDVARDVGALTKISYPGMNRAAVLAAYGAQLSAASVDVQVAKACDIVDNIGSIAEHDPKFGVVYAAEKLEEIALLSKLPPNVAEYVKGIVIAARVDSERNIIQNALGKKAGVL